MSIHREGYPSLAYTVLGLGVLNFLSHHFLPESHGLHLGLLIFSIIFFLIILQFFRKPTRIATLNANHIIAPCDGKVVVIEEVIENEYLQEPCRQISIFMSPINVHINWNPIGGIVRYFKYHPGKFLVAWHPKSSTENERTTTVIEAPNGTKVLFRQIAGALAKRIVWYVKEGQKVEQGSEMGFIKFGSRVDIFIPLTAEVQVNLEQKTTGNKTVLAVLK